jgi:hypothetical protein
MTLRSPPFLFDPKTACKILAEFYKDEAGAEALQRAFICEHNSQHARAWFWIEVYVLLAERDGGMEH